MTTLYCTKTRCSEVEPTTVDTSLPAATLSCPGGYHEVDSRPGLRVCAPRKWVSEPCDARVWLPSGAFRQGCTEAVDTCNADSTDALCELVARVCEPGDTACAALSAIDKASLGLHRAKTRDYCAFCPLSDHPICQYWRQRCTANRSGSSDHSECLSVLYRQQLLAALGPGHPCELDQIEDGYHVYPNPDPLANIACRGFLTTKFSGQRGLKSRIPPGVTEFISRGCARAGAEVFPICDAFRSDDPRIQTLFNGTKPAYWPCLHDDYDRTTGINPVCAGGPLDVCDADPRSMMCAAVQTNPPCGPNHPCAAGTVCRTADGQCIDPLQPRFDVKSRSSTAGAALAATAALIALAVAIWALALALRTDLVLAHEYSVLESAAGLDVILWVIALVLFYV